jgi:transposase
VQEGAFTAIRAGEEVVPLSEMKELRAHVRELERLLGKKTMEVEILKDAIRIAREKKLISRVPLLGKDDTR